MKKIFTLMAAAVMVLTANAKDFKGDIAIDLGFGGEPITQETTISVDEVEGSDGLYNITLANFSFGETVVGDITMTEIKGDDVEPSEGSGEQAYTEFEQVTKTATIANGSDLAEMLGGEVDVTINEGSRMTESTLDMNISLVVSVPLIPGQAPMQMNIKASFSGDVVLFSQNFTNNLTVTMGGKPTEPQSTTINVAEQEDGKYTLTLKNFMLGTMGVGTIVLSDVEGTEADGVITLKTEQSITIAAGDDENVDKWFGPNLGSVPVSLEAKMTSDNLDAVITINMLGGIKVVFGNDITKTLFNQNFTNNLTVTMGGKPTEPQSTTINVAEQEDGKYTLTLKNFMLGTMGVGTIVLSDVEGTEADGVITLKTEQSITIAAGDDENVDKWFGPNLGSVPVSLEAKMTSDNLDAVITINMLGGIKVVFGKDITSGINNITTTTDNGIEAIYDLSGKKLNEMQKGINIVRKADGTTVKVLKK